jgi:acetyltransferase-like isoleucine patch superfamily enzyme
MRAVIEQFARQFRGADYTIDPNISFAELAGISLRRLFSVGRGLLRGYNWTIRSRNWIFFGPRVVLRNRRCIRLGRGVTLGNDVFIDGLSREGVTLGDGVNIGPYTIILVTGRITDLGKSCVMGCNSALGAFSFIGAAGGVRIGNDVIMGQRVSFHSENHLFNRTDIPIRMQGVSRQGIVIEDDCWVGANVVFLDGAYVERGCVIAAGAVVRGHVPAHSVIGGVPARVLKSRLTESPC